MTNVQSSKFAVFLKILAFLLKYDAVLKPIKRVAKIITEFNTAFTNLKDAQPPAPTTSSTKPTTKTKNAKFKKLITTIVSLAGRAYFYAVDQKDDNLKQIFTVTANSFTKNMSEPDKIKLATDILTALKAHDTSLIADYNIKAQELTDVAALIKSANDDIAKPGTQIGNRKTLNALFAKQFPIVQAKLDELVKGIQSNFPDTDPANDQILLDLQNALERPDQVHHAHLITTILDSLNQDPLEGVLVEITAQKKSALSNIDGIATIDKIKPGKYKVNISFASYTTQIITFTIKKGQKTTLSVNLIKI